MGNNFFPNSLIECCVTAHKVSVSAIPKKSFGYTTTECHPRWLICATADDTRLKVNNVQESPKQRKFST